jgi:hypothetical protein
LLYFLYNSIWNVSHSKKWAKYDHKYLLVFVCSTRNSCQILMKLEFSRQIFQKCTRIKFHENPLKGRRVVAAGWIHRPTDGQTEGRTNKLKDRQTDKHTNRQTDMKLRVAFRNSVNAPKKVLFYFNNHAYSLQH